MVYLVLITATADANMASMPALNDVTILAGAYGRMAIMHGRHSWMSVPTD